MATPHNATPAKENILGAEQGQGCSLKVFARTNRIKPPDRVCQSESGLPKQTTDSVWRSAFADLGIAFFGIEAAVSQRQKQV